MEQLTARLGHMAAAINRITNEYQTAASRLDELEAALPGLIAAIALKETGPGQMEETRQEISRLRLVVKEPYQKAIEIIRISQKQVLEQISKINQQQAAIDQERAFREFFNHCLETRSRTNTDWDLLRGGAQHYHRNDIELLDSLHYEFERNRFHYQPGSPTFVKFADSKGLPLYNLDVTYENMTQPKAR